jgi:hypothetical protein
MEKMLYTSLLNMIASSHMWLLSTWNVADVTEDGIFYILFHLYLNGHLCLVINILGNAFLQYHIIPHLKRKASGGVAQSKGWKVSTGKYLSWFLSNCSHVSSSTRKTKSAIRFRDQMKVFPSTVSPSWDFPELAGSQPLQALFWIPEAF